MSDQLPTQPQPLAPKPEEKPSTWREFIKGCHETFWRWYGFDTLADDFKSHGGAVRKGAALKFLCGVVIVTGVICVFCRGCYDESEIRSSDDNARSNDDLAKSYKSQLDAANTMIVNLKVDAAETKREKDMEISDLKTENVSLHSQIADFQSTHIMEVSSNFEGSISNVLRSAAYPQANIALWVNDKTTLIVSEYPAGTVTQAQNFVALTTNREIRMRVMNTAKYPAIHASVDFTGAIAPTNILSDGWIQQPVLNPEMNHWRYDADKSIPKNSYWDISTLRVSTNYQKGYLVAEIGIGADNSEGKMYLIEFLIPQ
ncbi:MAG: hypothetical protein ABSD57_05260 [Verrucomicrobiota bacterium]|jgi:hypothetical protein